MTLHADPAIDAAIRVTYRTHPYYATALGRLRIVADPAVSTMSTSAKWVTHYNPATVAGWTVDETAAVLVHELEHLLRDHSGRCGTRDPGRFNVAADAEINQRLPGLPDGAVYPETLGLPRGLTAEAYYGAAPDPEPEPQPGDGGPGDGAGQSGDGGTPQPGSGAGQSGSGQPKCGSAAGGPVQPHEAADGDDPGSGALDPDGTRKATAEAVLAQGRGTDPGDEMRQWAETVLDIDRASWYSALSTVVGRTLAPYGAPTRWLWPGRRDIRDMGGAMVPRWTGERPQCAVVIDTSGSITAGDLDMAVAAGHFLARVADVTYYGCDSQPTRYGATIPAALGGGGGTNMVRGIDLAIADGARAVIVITDCDTPWPSDPTPVPLIIGANASPYATHVAAASAMARSMPSGRLPEWATVVPIRQPE